MRCVPRAVRVVCGVCVCALVGVFGGVCVPDVAGVVCGVRYVWRVPRVCWLCAWRAGGVSGVDAHCDVCGEWCVCRVGCVHVRYVRGVCVVCVVRAVLGERCVCVYVWIWCV